MKLNADPAKETSMAASDLHAHAAALRTIEEQQARVNLAALYRLFVHYGWTDLTYTHIAARVPGEAGCYLINPYGLLFEEITASSLNKVEFSGRVVSGQHPYNKAGHLIHTSVLQARPEINYVIHSHTRAGAAVSAMKCGLLPLSQHANVIRGILAYHPYAVADEGPEECERLVADLGGNYLVILHNHGLLACGRSAGEAFLNHYFLEMACEIQVDVLRSGESWIAPDDSVLEELAAWGRPRPKPWGDKQWAAMLRLLDRKDSSFRD
jgi:ribulose-5-phosphate 4-epimerase/fuculose-1-phosphate aldolase